MRKSCVSLVALCLFVASLTTQAQVNVTTYHNDNTRTGQNTAETVLNPANVNSNQFGKMFSVAVDGYVYAQPLYLSNVTISGSTHNVLYVATEHDSVYAIDADTGVVYWQASLLPSGGSTVNSNSDIGCGDLVPEIGITSTPVIDTSSGTIYVLAKSKVSGIFVQHLHALDIAAHTEKFGGPVLIQATVNGTGDGSAGGKITFDALHEANRPGLLLQNGHVIIAWASHCDLRPYHGWVMSYNSSTLAQEAVFNTTPNGGLGGVWMGGGGVAADSNSNFYFATGNGSYDGTTGFGDSVVKLATPNGGNFPIADWFTPFNQSTLDGGDTDLGSGGVLLLPDLTSGSHPHLLVEMGKEGTIYVLDRDNMGKFCSTCTSHDTQIVQEIPGATSGVWGTPAYWNGWVYWGAAGDGGSPDNLKAYSFNANNSGMLSTSPTSKSSQLFGFSGPSPSISANSASNGILWGLDDSTFSASCCQVLYAYDATNLANMLYNSNQAANSRDVPGASVKFATPTIANGKVYVGSQYKISAFGIISTTPTAATPTFNPAPGSYTSSVNVSLSDTTSGAVIHCTTDRTTPTSSSPVCTTLAVSATTTIEAVAVASGYNNSVVTTGTYTISISGQGVNYGNGFTSSSLTLNGKATINGTRLRLTDGGINEAGSAFYKTLVNVQNFTNDFIASVELSECSASIRVEETVVKVPYQVGS